MSQRGFLLRHALVLAMSLNLITLGWAPAVNAEVVSTAAFNQSLTRDARIAHVNNFLSQDNVRGQLVGLGVDPKDAQARVASLTDAELATLNQRIDTLPAGGDSVFVVLGVVFLVLVILELVGVINVFKSF